MRLVKSSDDIAILDVIVDNSPVNVWNENSVNEFSQLCDEVISWPNVKGLIILSSRPEFMVGADLKSLMPLSDVSRNRKTVRKLKESFRKLEKWTKPVVSVVEGTALGGGFELCLSCNYRLVRDDEGIRLGLPEATLGLLPGAGGTQRLSRLIGISEALQFMVEGKKVSPRTAKSMGLIHDLASDHTSLIEKAKQYITSHPQVSQPWDEKGYKIPGGMVQTPQGMTTFSASAALVKQKTFGNYTAPLAILSAVYEGMQVPFDLGLEIEEEYFIQCMKSPEATSIIRTMFLHVNELHKGMGRPKGVDRRKFQKVGVLGAGMMGSGIAYSLARAGVEVVLKDVSLDAAIKGKAYSEKILKPLVEKEKISASERDNLLSRIHVTDKASDLSSCEWIIEAVTEDRVIKQKVFKEAIENIPKTALIASNTSTLPITGLSEYTDRPEDFVGVHFFSPVEKMQLVEIIRGRQSSDKVVASAWDLVRSMDKTPVIVNDGRGFFTSRVFSSYVNAGCACLRDGIAPALIENAGKMAGMPVGPLAVADEVSIDLIYHIILQTEKDLGKSDGSAASVISKLFVEKLKRLGRKSGAGFYEYSEQGKKLWSGLSDHFQVSREQPPVAEVKRRLLHAQAVEALRALDEGVITSLQDGDVASILGWGFPAHTGGIFSYIEGITLGRFVAECEELRSKWGDDFKVPEKFRHMSQLPNATNTTELK